MAKAPKTATETLSADTPATDQTADAAASDATSTASTNDASLPTQIRMAAPHGFIDEEGKYGEAGKSFYWQQGQVVFDPAHVALLHERQASFEAVEPAKQ